MRIALAPVLLCVACGPQPPKPPAPPIPVQPAALVKIYRDFPLSTADAAYRGYRIICRLDPGTYTVAPDHVGFLSSNLPDPPVILFRCQPPPDARSRLEITGVCRGLTRDGVRRGAGIDWFLVVDGCEVVSLPP